MAVRVEEALDGAGAAHRAGRSVRTLSGGERKRVAVASALAMRPLLVVLDEPTSQLDPEGASMVLDAVGDLVRQGRAAVIAEHRLERLLMQATASVIVENGSASGDWPVAYSPPAIRSTPSRGGAVAWSLAGVTAGFGGRPVLDAVALTGHQGELMALPRPNGGGKTTLLRRVSGALSPIAGEVERRPGRIAYLPPEPTASLHPPTLRSEVSPTLEPSAGYKP